MSERHAPGTETDDAMLLSILHAYQQRLRGLPGALDATVWRSMATTTLPAGATWFDICEGLSLRPVSVAALIQQAHRLVVLPADLQLRVLSARVLFSHCTELARCIDGSYLDELGKMLGQPAVDALTQSVPARLYKCCPLPPADLHLMAGMGLAALIADGWMTDEALIALLRLTAGLPFDNAATTPADGASEAFFRELPALYPELSWLFG